MMESNVNKVLADPGKYCSHSVRGRRRLFELLEAKPNVPTEDARSNRSGAKLRDQISPTTAMKIAWFLFLRVCVGGEPYAYARRILTSWDRSPA